MLRHRVLISGFALFQVASAAFFNVDDPKSVLAMDNDLIQDRELQTEYTEPSYWQRYRDDFGKKIKRCKYLNNIVPASGTPCQKMKTGDYTCLLGEETCPDGSTHPTTTCDCLGPQHEFNCQPFEGCNEPTTTETCPDEHPAYSQTQTKCTTEGLRCDYGTQSCCGGFVVLEESTCICNGGEFQCQNNDACRTMTCDQLQSLPTPNPIPSPSPSPTTSVSTPPPTDPTVPVSITTPTGTPISESGAPVPAPTPSPTAATTQAPSTAKPTNAPTNAPVPAPTPDPTAAPTPDPTAAPTSAPVTSKPSTAPTDTPVPAPTPDPTLVPTRAPAASKPTISPTVTGGTFAPTKRPTRRPTKFPTAAPVFAGTDAPVPAPTPDPTPVQTPEPTTTSTIGGGTVAPTKRPTRRPTNFPTLSPILIAPTPNPTSPIPINLTTSVEFTTDGDGPALLTRLVSELEGIGLIIAGSGLVPAPDGRVRAVVNVTTLTTDPTATQEAIKGVLAKIKADIAPSPGFDFKTSVTVRTSSDPASLATLLKAELVTLGLNIVGEQISIDGDENIVMFNVTKTLPDQGEAENLLQDIKNVLNTIQNLPASSPGPATASLTNYTQTVSIRTSSQSAQQQLIELKAALEAIGLTIISESTSLDGASTLVSVIVNTLTAAPETVQVQIQQAVESLISSSNLGTNLTTTVRVSTSGDGSSTLQELTSKLEAIGLMVFNQNITVVDSQNKIVSVDVTTITQDVNATSAEIRAVLDSLTANASSPSSGLNFTTTVSVTADAGQGQQVVSQLNPALTALGLTIESTSISSAGGSDLVMMNITKSVVDEAEANVLLGQVQQVVNNLATTNMNGINFVTNVTFKTQSDVAQTLQSLTTSLQNLGLKIEDSQIVPESGTVTAISIQVSKVVADQAEANTLSAQIQQVLESQSSQERLNFETFVTLRTNGNTAALSQQLETELEKLGLTILDTTVGPRDEQSTQTITVKVQKTVKDQAEAETLTKQISDVLNSEFSSS